MDKMKKQPQIIVLAISLMVLFICLLSVVLLFVVNSQDDSRPAQKVAVDITSRESVEKLIREAGGVGAYDLVKKEAQSLDVFERHGVGHRFGEILYNVEGVKGIQVCDGELSFGCFHSFTIAAIFDKGLSVANEIDLNCIEKYGILGHGCTHGIGHGLIEYFGATEEGLNNSLEVCRDLTYKGSVMGCKNGVFMEFNHPSPSAEGKLRSSRQFDDNNSYYPCNKIKAEFEPACYYEQGKWIHRTFGQLNEALDYCNALENGRNREVCLMGVGANAGEESNFDTQEAFAKCSYLSEGDGREFCVAGAEFIIQAVYPSLSADLLPCSMLESNAQGCRKNTASIVGEQESK